MLQRGIEGAKSIKDDDIAKFLRAKTMKTIMGDIKYGANGEWAAPE